MKNLFKSLMLVAVAAMAFTSCSQDVNEVNKLEKKTTFEFVASFDGDTRSGFTGSSEDENGTVMYHSEWFGGETVMLVAGDQVVTATVNAEGKFSATFEGEISQIDIYTPMDSFYKPYMDYNFYQVNPEVLAEQTPLTNSVDPKAHVAKGYVLVDAEGNQIIPVSLTHDVAYGKMTVNAPAEFVIDHVVVNLVGSYNNFTYTLNADNVENNTFWFATEPIEVAEFTVTAYDAEGNAVTKSVDVAAAEKTLAFNYGRVSTFSVSGLEEVEAPAEKYDSTYAYVYEDYGADDKAIMFVADDNRGLLIDFYKVYEDNSIVPGTYTFDGPGRMYPGWSYYYADVNGDSASELNGGQAVVSVEDGQYKIVFTNMADGSTVYVEQFTFKGEINGLQLPDTREKLAMPNATATVEGRTITISWNAVDNVDGYRVKLYSPHDEYFEEVVTGTEYVYEAELWNTQYSFTIMSYASDDNKTYKSSGDAYVNITTEKDPNVFADVVATNIVWDSSNGAFKMTGEVVSGTAWGHSNDYIRLYMNEADRPGNNSIKVGQYTGCGGTSPQAGQFGARLSLYWGNVTLPSAVGSASTLNVTYDESIGYTIVLTHNGVSYGYKGMPDGWVAPSEGGDEPDPEPDPKPDPEQPDDVVADGKSLETAYKFTTYTKKMDFGYPVMCLSGSEDGAIFEFESNGQSQYPTGLQKFNSGAWYTNWIVYHVGGTIIHDTVGNTQAGGIILDQSYTYLTMSGSNYTVEYIKIVLTTGEEIWYTFDGTFTF